jgi:histidine ammonia-lyase
LRALLAGSEINIAHQDDSCHKVQDPYSMRCAPQVHGATRDALAYVRGAVVAELRSVTDNPLVFLDPDAPGGAEFLSGGNFHGQAIALAMDHLAIAVAELANISERRIEQLVNPMLSGLPPFLAPDPGLTSGFMIAQVAAASVVSENKVLCHPASVDSIPSSANREDHVSMGTFAASKARTVVENVRAVLATELLCAAQALEMRGPELPGVGVAAALQIIRRHVPPLTEDRRLDRDVIAVTSLIDSGLYEAVRSAADVSEDA